MKKLKKVVTFIIALIVLFNSMPLTSLAETRETTTESSNKEAKETLEVSDEVKEEYICPDIVEQIYNLETEDSEFLVIR